MRAYRVLAGSGMAIAVSLTVPAAASARTGQAPMTATATTTTLTSSRASSSYDSPVTFTAQVTAASGIPSGAVTFTDVSNGSVLAAKKLSSGKASFTTAALAPGTRSIRAHYRGDSTFGASSSGALSIPVAAAGSDAVAYQIDARHDGHQAGGGLTASSLTKKWHVDLISGYVSYPVIAGGRVFVTAGNGGGGTILLYALSATTGQTEWSAVVGETPTYVTLAYDGRTLFSFTPDGVLTAYRASTGHELWLDQLPGQTAFPVSPTAYDGVVYVGVSGVGGTVYAVREADGYAQWARSVLNGDGSSPAVDDSGAYVSYAEQQDYRFGLGGRLVWHYAPSGDGGGGSTPALHGGSVYARGDPAFDPPVILSKTSGRVTGGFTSDYEPAFAGISMYTLNSGNLVALPASGSPIRWAFASRNLDTAPVVDNGVVYALSASGYVYGVSASSGTKIWRGSVGQATNGPILSGIAAGGGLLMVPAGSTLTAFGN